MPRPLCALGFSLVLAACSNPVPAKPAPGGSAPNPARVQQPSTPSAAQPESAQPESAQPPQPSAAPETEECVNRERAIVLANEGDRHVRTELDAAIANYESAVTLDPTNHFLYWKLGAAYERGAEWSKAATTYVRAAALAPQYAHYWYRAGYAWWMLGEQNEADAHAAAKEPLLRCVYVDEAFADCHFLLGRVEGRLGNDGAATVHLTRAIELAPLYGPHYPPLVAAYSRLGKRKFALQVASEGIRFLEPNRRNAGALYALEQFALAAARKRGNSAAARRSEERAEAFAQAAQLDRAHFDLECGCAPTPAVIARPAQSRATPQNTLPSVSPPLFTPRTGYDKYDPSCPPKGGAYESLAPFVGPGVDLPVPSRGE